MQVTSTVNTDSWLPAYHHKEEHIYILLTSLNLGGAEKIVSDQLWANHYSRSVKKITLIVIYDKQKEHSLPPEINVVRLNNRLENGELLFKQIAYEAKPLVCHLINDKMSHYLFGLGLNLHMVIHNDKRAWSVTSATLNHPQLISVVAVAEFVKRQVEDVCDKPVYTFRHQIKEFTFAFNDNRRQRIRGELGLHTEDILIGMTGRICQQKNYFLALDILALLVKENPHYKMVILGGFEPFFFPLYMKLLQKINHLGLHKNVFLPGFKTDIYNWINAFDIGLNTSYFEGLSMATQELIMNGLPMVLSRVAGQPEIFDKHKQLDFFDIPAILDTPDTNQFSIYTERKPLNDIMQAQFDSYIQLVVHITTLIKANHIKGRIAFNEDDKKLIARLCYGSHNNWNLLNHIYPVKTEIKNTRAFNDNTVIENPLAQGKKKVAFITSNLNAGGAQRSMVNLLKQFKSHDLSIPLILINQSNQQQYFDELIEHKIPYYLCHASIDVFDICSNLFTYLCQENIERLVLWNVDAKMKLLLSKFFSHRIDLIDVSPGDYILSEMARETDFQEAIYYDEREYFSSLYRFVSKYDNTARKETYKQWLKHDTIIIPNGVYIKEEYIGAKKPLAQFKMLVCGRIAPSKHLETIYSAWREFIRINPHVNCVLESYGSVEPCYMEYYEELNHDYADLLATGQIRWMGHHEQPMKIMQEYHAIVVLGTHQGSPNVVLEAGSCKLPVIANDSGGTREVINESTGYLLPVKPEVEPLVQAIHHLYHNYDEAWQKAENCFDHIVNVFSMDAMENNYLKVIYG